MPQNESSAVMQQRHDGKDSPDDFPTPPWATRALCEWLVKDHNIHEQIVREPACGRLTMVNPLLEYFDGVMPSDLYDYGAAVALRDYLTSDEPEVDWTITNPPFKYAEAFILKARQHSRNGVAMLVRSAFLETVGRYHRIFAQDPPHHILQFSERVVMHKGKLVSNGSTATAYCWLVWSCPGDFPLLGSEFHWIAPCRKRLEREGDYVLPCNT